MAESKNVDEFIYEACRQDKERLLALGPDFKKIETEALAKFKQRKKTRMRKVLVQAIAAVAAVFIIVNGAVVLSSVPGVRAYGETVRKYFFNFVNNIPKEYDDEFVLKTTDALKDVQAKVPYQIPFPHWLPEGYELVDAYSETGNNNVYRVITKYNQPNAGQDKMIIVSITNLTILSNTTPPPDEPPVEKKEVAGYDVYIRVKSDNPIDSFYGTFYTKKGLSISVTGPLDITVFTQILVSFPKE